MAELLCKWLESEHGILTTAEQLDQVSIALACICHSFTAACSLRAFITTGLLFWSLVCSTTGQLWTGSNSRLEIEQHKPPGAAPQLHSAAGLAQWLKSP